MSVGYFSPQEEPNSSVASEQTLESLPFRSEQPHLPVVRRPSSIRFPFSIFRRFMENVTD